MRHFTHVLTSVGMSVFLAAFTLHMPGFVPGAALPITTLVIWIFTAATIVSMLTQLMVARQHRKGNQHCMTYFDRLNMQMITTGSIVTIASIAVLGWGIIGGWLITPYSSIPRTLIFAAGVSLAVSALVWSNMRQLYRKINSSQPKALSISLSAVGFAAVIAIIIATSIANSSPDTTAIISLVVWFAAYYLYTRIDLRDRKSTSEK